MTAVITTGAAAKRSGAAVVDPKETGFRVVAGIAVAVAAVAAVGTEGPVRGARPSQIARCSWSSGP